MKALRSLSNRDLWEKWKDTFDSLGDPLDTAAVKKLDTVEDEIIARIKQASRCKQAQA